MTAKKAKKDVTLMTVAQVHKAYSMPENTVIAWCDCGKIACTAEPNGTGGKRWSRLMKRCDVEAALQKYCGSLEYKPMRASGKQKVAKVVTKQVSKKSAKQPVKAVKHFAITVTAKAAAEIGVGDVVCLRGYYSGVHIGTLGGQTADGYTILHNSRRVFYWDGAATLSELAEHGCEVQATKNSKICVTVPYIEILSEDIKERLLMTPKAQAWLKAQPDWRKTSG